LNVSVVTVSNALHNRHNVSEKTRKLILKTAKELNYIPDDIARSLAGKDTKTIGVLIPDISDSFFVEILNSIENIASKNNYNIILINTKWDKNIEYESVKILLQKRVSGILLSPIGKDSQYSTLLKNGNTPFVLFNYADDTLEASSVINDNVYGAYLAVNYLIEKGYEKIYYIYSLSSIHTCDERIKGCKKAFKKHKIPMEQLKLLDCKRSFDDYYNITKNNVNYAGERIGIFGWDDDLSAVICRAVIDKGLKIPEEVGVIGYDNVEMSKYSIVPLTTIHNPSYKIGIKATEILLEMIESGRELKEHKRVVLKPRLIIRESS
ncbi:LacI family DNA-binding transcriptional regulator, partial [bacterium]|nr:LacI family DNA-binding transcriptional regulator [bacterium]